MIRISVKRSVILSAMSAVLLASSGLTSAAQAQSAVVCVNCATEPTTQANLAAINGSILFTNQNLATQLSLLGGQISTSLQAQTANEAKMKDGEAMQRRDEIADLEKARIEQQVPSTSKAACETMTRAGARGEATAATEEHLHTNNDDIANRSVGNTVSGAAASNPRFANAALGRAGERDAYFQQWARKYCKPGVYSRACQSDGTYENYDINLPKALLMADTLRAGDEADAAKDAILNVAQATVLDRQEEGTLNEPGGKDQWLSRQIMASRANVASGALMYMRSLRGLGIDSNDAASQQAYRNLGDLMRGKLQEVNAPQKLIDRIPQEGISTYHALKVMAWDRFLGPNSYLPKTNASLEDERRENQAVELALLWSIYRQMELQTSLLATQLGGQVDLTSGANPAMVRSAAWNGAPAGGLFADTLPASFAPTSSAVMPGNAGLWPPANAASPLHEASLSADEAVQTAR